LPKVLELGGVCYNGLRVSEADDTEEFELARRWAEGDRVAGRLIVERYYDRLRRFFISNIRDDVVREDLIQETFLRLTKAIGGFQSRAPLRVFVFTIATRTLYDHFRHHYKAGVFDPLQSSLEDVDAETPSKRMADIERCHQLFSCIRKLPIDLKQLLELRYWQGLSAAELAEIFSIKDVTVRVRLFSIRAKLRACLERNEATSPTDAGKDPFVELDRAEGIQDIEEIDPDLVAEIREIGRLVDEMS
jgi:RNA polymerase sigma-70 factor (ECF subfamily)